METNLETKTKVMPKAGTKISVRWENGITTEEVVISHNSNIIYLDPTMGQAGKRYCKINQSQF